jgi:hypothetical protein
MNLNTLNYMNFIVEIKCTENDQHQEFMQNSSEQTMINI